MVDLLDREILSFEKPRITLVEVTWVDELPTNSWLLDCEHSLPAARVSKVEVDDSGSRVIDNICKVGAVESLDGP